MKTKLNLSVFVLVLIVFGLTTSCEQNEILIDDFSSSDDIVPVLKSTPSYKGWNPTWSNLIGSHSRATTDAEQVVLRNKVANGTIDTDGTYVNVPNSIVERTGTGTRSVMSNSLMRWHNPLNSQVTDPGENTRWYQKDGNTQVFRVFPYDQNWQSSREGAARSEAFSSAMGTRRYDNKVMTFSARYRVAAHNGTKAVKIFQAKATAANGFDPAWCVALDIEADGDIIIIKRGVTWAQNEYIDTGYGVGQSFNLRVTDDGYNYKVFINNVLKASGSYYRGNLLTVCRWGAYVQGGSSGILTGSVSNPEIVYVSGARVTLN